MNRIQIKSRKLLALAGLSAALCASVLESQACTAVLIDMSKPFGQEKYGIATSKAGKRLDLERQAKSRCKRAGGNPNAAFPAYFCDKGKAVLMFGAGPGGRRFASVRVAPTTEQASAEAQAYLASEGCNQFYTARIFRAK